MVQFVCVYAAKCKGGRRAVGPVLCFPCHAHNMFDSNICIYAHSHALVHICYTCMYMHVVGPSLAN